MFTEDIMNLNKMCDFETPGPQNPRFPRKRRRGFAPGEWKRTRKKSPDSSGTGGFGFMLFSP